MLVATDLDGTLLRSHDTISAYHRGADPARPRGGADAVHHGATIAVEALDGIRFAPDYVLTGWPRHDRHRGVLARVWTTVTSASPHLLKLSAPGANKATTLARVCAHLDIEPGEVVDFGDMPDDAPMPTWAGRSCVVAGADPIARAAATAVSASHDDFGVAQLLGALFDFTPAPTLASRNGA